MNIPGGSLWHRNKMECMKTKGEQDYVNYALPGNSDQMS